MQRQVPDLGVVDGIDSGVFKNIEQYNGIPYGTISARFRQAKLASSWPGNKWDGTKYGPICPFPKMVIGHGLTQAKLAPQHNYDMDEFKCLNLNITCPKGSTPMSGWPVMVWLHGGGNCVGMGSDPGYNGGPLVDMSVKKGTPIVVVTLNYRLGAFGFLASKEIKEDNKKAGDAGYGNYALRDQLLAYEWVKKNIKAFGGDPERITGVGHSAGSIDTHILTYSKLFSQQQPFTQAILQSGVSSRNVKSLEQQQKRYDLISSYLKINSDEPAADRLEALRDVPAEDLVKAYIALGTPVASWQGTVDDFFLDSQITPSTLASIQYPPFFKRLLLGDCLHEGLIFDRGVKKMNLDFGKVQTAAQQILGQEDASRVLQTYQITPEQTPEQLFTSAVELVTNGAWSQPIQAVAKSFTNGDVFYYHVSEGNPFDGPNKGMSHHGVDLLFNFLTYQSLLPSNLAELAEAYALHWISFINGGKPWTPYSQNTDGSSTLMSYSKEGALEIREDSKPTFATLQLCESLQDNFGKFEGSLRGEKA